MSHLPAGALPGTQQDVRFVIKAKEGQEKKEYHPVMIDVEPKKIMSLHEDGWRNKIMHALSTRKVPKLPKRRTGS